MKVTLIVDQSTFLSLTVFFFNFLPLSFRFIRLLFQARVKRNYEMQILSLTSCSLSRHRPTTAPPLPGNFTAEPNWKTKRNLNEYTITFTDRF